MHTEDQPLTSTKPYLTRAIYEWILDNGLTPHLLVDAGYPGTEVPAQFVQDGQIILNLAPTAVRNLVMGNEWISFGARFSGTPYEILIPSEAVLGVFSRENRQGMVFAPPEHPEQGSPKPEGDSQAAAEPIKGTPGPKDPRGGKPKGGPRLKVVK
jgi:stringent starvation protein B